MAPDVGNQRVPRSIKLKLATRTQKSEMNSESLKSKLSNVEGIERVRFNNDRD